MANLAYTPRKGWFTPTWNSLGMGVNNKVEPKLKLEIKPITRGSTGGKNVVLGYWVVGLGNNNEIDIEIKDVYLLAFTNNCPWMTASTNQIMIPSTPNQNLASYTQNLTLHPNDKGDATEDAVFPAATPFTPPTFVRTGDDDEGDVWKVSFKIFPVLSKITASTPKLVYGWIGSTTPSDAT